MKKNRKKLKEKEGMKYGKNIRQHMNQILHMEQGHIEAIKKDEGVI